MSSKCARCGEEAELKNSHIIPNFVFKHLKKSGATPFLKNIDDPDERRQDYHEKLLCGECEQYFNQFESPVAGRIYHPYRKEQATSFQYDDWLHKFVISVNWRLMKSKLSQMNLLSQSAQDAVSDAETIWFDILNENLPASHDPFTHHMVLFRDLDLRTDSKNLPDKWEFYRDRATDATVIEAGPHYYFKLPRIAFISCIQPPHIEGFKNTKIQQSGEIGTPQRIPRKLENYIVTRAARAFDVQSSERSQEKILEWMKENPERLAESESYQAWAEGKVRQIENHDATKYLDEDCPVCYTDHRVIESLPRRPVDEEEIQGWGDRYIYFQPIYYRGKLKHPEASETETTTIVFSSEKKTMQLSLYDGVGWVVEKEIDLGDEIDPVEMGKMLHDSTYADYVEVAEKYRRRSS